MKNVLIYILDQNPTQGNFLKYHLVSSGFKNVRNFSTQDECFYTFHKNVHPGFIIIDPGNNGSSVLTFIQVVKQFDPAVRFIIFSSNIDEIEMMTFLDAGVTDYIANYGDHQKSLIELVYNLQFILKEAE